MMMMMGKRKTWFLVAAFLAQNASTRTPSTTVTMLMTMKMPDNDDVSDAQMHRARRHRLWRPNTPNENPFDEEDDDHQQHHHRKKNDFEERTTTSLLSSRPPRGE